jgi:hypothetical protein
MSDKRSNILGADRKTLERLEEEGADGIWFLAKCVRLLADAVDGRITTVEGREDEHRRVDQDHL